jgi:TldD protein
VPVSRRHFLTSGAAAAALAWFPRRASASGHHLLVGARRADPDLHALAARAVEAARAAGATYADVRLTHRRDQNFIPAYMYQDDEHCGVGVRALVNGYWGFMGSVVWAPDEMARLARGAVDQARANGQGATRRVELGVVPVVTGTWTMPVVYDPFDIPIDEKWDFLRDLLATVKTYRNADVLGAKMGFTRIVKVFASTEGTSWQQTTYVSDGAFGVTYGGQYTQALRGGGAAADDLSPAGKGWELFHDARLVERIPALLDEAAASRRTAAVDIGMYDAVFSAQAMAALVDATIGPATQLDRALGDEANAEGSSYLTDPLGMLGTQTIGSRQLTLRANRSVPGGAATVKWDDEGVVPEPFTIVRDGLLVDMQTTREQAAWLAPYYQKAGLPIRSHGCAGGESALNITMQHSPNLELVPSAENVSFDDLVASTKKGIAVTSLRTNVDQQQSDGTGYPRMRLITDGKLGPTIVGGGIMFRSSELWKNLLGLGGPGTQAWYGFTRGKGQPRQTSTHSIGAVPGKVANIRVIDVEQRA